MYSIFFYAINLCALTNCSKCPKCSNSNCICINYLKNSKIKIVKVIK